MSKRLRIMVVICIVVAALSFMGGMIYKYEDYKPMIELTPDLSKYYFEFKMPIDIETATYWLGWASEYHNSLINEKLYTDKTPQRFHQDSVVLYSKIKALFIEFDEEWGE